MESSTSTLFAGPVEPNKAHHYMACVKATCQQNLSLITKFLVEAVVIWPSDLVKHRSWEDSYSVEGVWLYFVS